MENTQNKVYAKYTFASISLALVLITTLALILIGESYNFIDFTSFQRSIGMFIVYIILSLIGITLVIRAYKYIYTSKKQGVPVKGAFLTSVAAIIFVLVFGLFSFSTYEIVRMEIDPCYKPASNVDCLPLPLR